MTSAEQADRLLVALAALAQAEQSREVGVISAEQAAGLDFPLSLDRRRTVEFLARRGDLIIKEWFWGNDAEVRLTPRGS